MRHLVLTGAPLGTKPNLFLAVNDPRLRRLLVKNVGEELSEHIARLAAIQVPRRRWTTPSMDFSWLLSPKREWAVVPLTRMAAAAVKAQQRAPPSSHD